MKTAILCSLIATFLLVSLIPINSAFAEEEGSLEVFVTFSTTGLRVSPNEMVVKVYQGFDKTPIQEYEVPSNPFLIENLPLDSSYKIEIYNHSIFSSFGLLKMEQPEQSIDLTVPGTGGLQIQVLHNDRVTPVSDVDVEIFAFDGNRFTKTSTFLYGETPRMFLPITTKDTDYFYADIIITENITKRVSPITIYKGNQELKVITDWPAVVEKLFTVKVLDENKARLTNEKGYTVHMLDKEGQLVQKSYLTPKGEAHFSNFMVNDYDLVLRHGLEDVSRVSVSLTGEQSDLEMLIQKPVETEPISVPFVEEKNPTVGKIISIPFVNNTEVNEPEVDEPEVTEPISVPFVEEETSKENQNCNCVAFRLSNVQDNYLNNVQFSLIELFDSKDTNLTVGITGDSIGDDPVIVDLVNEKLEKKNLLLANLGWEKVDFTTLSEQEQFDSINDTNEKILEVFGQKSSIFIAPYSKFNENTIKAVQANGMKYFSSTVSSDPPPYNFQNSVPLHVPYTHAIKNVISSEDSELKGNVNGQLQLIQEELDDLGFVVINMQSQDFAQKDDGFKNVIDSEKLFNLELLIDALNKEGIKIVPFDEIPTLVAPKTPPTWVDRLYLMYEQGEINHNDVMEALDYLIQKKII